MEQGFWFWYFWFWLRDLLHFWPHTTQTWHQRKNNWFSSGFLIDNHATSIRVHCIFQFVFYFPIFNLSMNSPVKLKQHQETEISSRVTQEPYFTWAGAVFEVNLFFYCNCSCESRTDLEGHKMGCGSRGPYNWLLWKPWFCATKR